MTTHALSHEEALLSVGEHMAVLEDLCKDREYQRLSTVDKFKWLEMPGVAGDYVNDMPPLKDEDLGIDFHRVGSTLLSAERAEILALLPKQTIAQEQPELAPELGRVS